MTCLALILPLFHIGGAFGADMTAIELGKEPYSVKIKLTGESPYKVVQFDKKELLVAFKNTRVPDKLVPKGDGSPFIRQVKIAQRQRDIVSLIITTDKDIGAMSALWHPVGNYLLVTFSPTGSRVKEKHVKKRSRTRFTAKSEAAPPVTSHGTVSTGDVPEDSALSLRTGGDAPGKVVEEEIGFSLGDRIFDKRYAGSTDDLFLELRSDACGDLGEVKRGIILCNQGAWDRAFDIFNPYGEDRNLGVNCLENILILKAYSFFKSINKGGGPKDYLDAARYFQDLISYYPDSIYVPYALTCMGKIYGKLEDTIKAEGYFQVVLKNYTSYPGTPEVMFELGRIYTEKKDNTLAVSILRNVVTQFPHGAFIGNAKYQLGKALFNINDFQASLAIFEDLVQSKPRMVFETPELLPFLGNAYYHNGKIEKARQVLARAYNLFPDMEGKDTLLTRIGDTFVEENQKDKAVKIFQLVVDKYPGTDGYVISTMRLAEYLESREEKEKMYAMVIKEFPDNPLSRLALMRLALLQHDAGDYEKSVETIKTLLTTQPRALKKDAVNLMQDSSELMFKKLLENNEYTEILGRFEADKRILDESENPNLFLLVGMAYLKAHLHENAVDMLLKSYKRTGEKKRPADLIYALGVAMDEAGQPDESLDMFKTYIRFFPEKEDVEDVYSRMGGIYFGKNQFKEAVQSYKKALSKSRTNANKARILVDISRSYKESKDYSTAVTTLIQAINLLAGEPKESFDTLSLAHRNLGENYMKLKAWDKAADALTMAVKFAGQDVNTTEIYFMMGEAFQNNRKFDDAEKAYMNVVEKGDSFWSSMAKERLRSMKLREKLENT